MAKHVIHIFGASGSGTSTLGKKICDELGYNFMDTDDYFWLPTDPKYTTKRHVEERLAMMRKDIQDAENVVISGSLVDWGDALIPLFTLAIRLETPTDIRISRLKQRERECFGTRIDLGGDMFAQHQEFIAWAKTYDSGDLSMRSKARHDQWQKQLPCKLLKLNGADDLDVNFEAVRKALERGDETESRGDEKMKLIEPTMAYDKQIQAYRREFLFPGMSMDGGGSLIRFDSTREWLAHVEAYKKQETVPKDRVPTTQYIYVRQADQKMVGAIQIRHYLNDVLAKYSGHIGYSVAPSERRKGYATQMLALVLPKCRALGINKVLITCVQGNEGSRRTILKNGGTYESTVYEPDRDRYLERYWIDLANRA